MTILTLCLRLSLEPEVNTDHCFSGSLGRLHRTWHHIKPDSNFCLFVCFLLLGPHLWHMEVPRLGVKWELQLQVDATATATQDLSQICLQQCQNFNH